LIVGGVYGMSYAHVVGVDNQELRVARESQLFGERVLRALRERCELRWQAGTTMRVPIRVVSWSDQKYSHSQE